jgi:hypothetical protein
MALPPPLPPSGSALNVVLGMTAQHVVFHCGIELERLSTMAKTLEHCGGEWGPGRKPS